MSNSRRVFNMPNLRLAIVRYGNLTYRNWPRPVLPDGQANEERDQFITFLPYFYRSNLQEQVAEVLRL